MSESLDERFASLVNEGTNLLYIAVENYGVNSPEYQIAMDNMINLKSILIQRERVNNYISTVLSKAE